MKIIETSTVNPDDLSPFERECVYNGLDACVTSEILGILLPQLDSHTQATYALSKSLQGPVLEMRLRGVLVDQAHKALVIEEYFHRLDHLERNLYRIVADGCGMTGFNWRSNKDLHTLFYGILEIPVVKRFGKPTVNRDALERMEAYTVARQIVLHMKAMRELGKRISMLKTEIDKDGRIRTSYNIAGTNTGRFSSSFSEFGTGGNLQNVEDLLRRILIADPGMKMGYFDAEQIQSRIVGALEWNLLGDPKYLDACESGDLHTEVSKLCWPELPWTGDRKTDKEIAEQPFYRHHSYRFTSKRLGHGTNFNGKPPHMANETKIDIDIVTEFRRQYFQAFPGHQGWHHWTREEIRSTGTLISLTGRKRQFWGRRDTEDTVREALAYCPQADESHIVNSGMLQVWRARNVQLLMQNHDAIIVQYPEKMEDEIVPMVLDQLHYPVELAKGRQLVIPYGCKTGWNFGECSKDNPYGLKTYKPGDQRRRPKETSILDRPIRSLHR